MRCRKVRSFLSAYCRDELMGRRQAAVSEHLLNCRSCRTEEEVYRQMFAAMAEMPEEPVSEDFNARLLDRIAQERFAETRTKAYLPKSAPLFSWRKAVPAFVAACLAIFAIVSMMPSHQPGAPAMADKSADDAYLTVQPVSNPNMTVHMPKGWSLDRQLAQAERANRIRNNLMPVGSFGRSYATPVSTGAPLTGRPVPYLRPNLQMRPVVKTYVSPAGATVSQEGDKPY